MNKEAEMIWEKAWQEVLKIDCSPEEREKKFEAIIDAWRESQWVDGKTHEGRIHHRDCGCKLCVDWSNTLNIGIDDSPWEFTGKYFSTSSNYKDIIEYRISE